MLEISKHTAYVPIQKRFLGFGDNAIYNTLKLMKEIIIESSENYYVRRWAENIVEGTNYGDYNKLQAIFNFLSNVTEYVKDTHGIEFLRTPIVSLQIIEAGDILQADCDDLVLLSLSLLRSIGIPVAMKAIAIPPSKDFSHVYGLAFISKRWIPIDLVRKDLGLGWEFPNPTRTYIMEIN